MQFSAANGMQVHKFTIGRDLIVDARMCVAWL